MNRLSSFILSRPYTLTIGLFLGLLLSPFTLTLRDAVMSFYDGARPVLEMRGEIVGKTDDAVLIHISGVKNRPCAYMNTQAYATTKAGIRDSFIERIDRPEQGATKPPGVYDIGIWKVWPTKGAELVTVVIQHSCDGRLVLTKVAEVRL